MSNRDYIKLNMDELDKVAGGIRVLAGQTGNTDPIIVADPAGIPRGGRVQVRV